MKKRELYQDPIKINEHFSIQIDTDNPDYLNIFKDSNIIEKFKLNRKIYTLFKVLQEYIKADDDILVEDNQAIIYGKEIYLYDDIFMKINADRACLTLDLYKKEQDKIKLVYLTKLIYTCHKLFYMLLIPKKLDSISNYYLSNIFKFLDMIEILKYETNHE